MQVCFYAILTLYSRCMYIAFPHNIDECRCHSRYFIHIRFKHTNMNFRVPIQAIVHATSNATSEYTLFAFLIVRFRTSAIDSVHYPHITISLNMQNVNSFNISLALRAIIRKCNNALHPDLYGHYREAKFTQTKHHWWWKSNRVFDQLDVTRHHTGLVLFLEEDHYVAEDFLYLLALMKKRALELCTKCNILSLGTYLKTFNYYTYSNKNKVSAIRKCFSHTLRKSGCINNSETDIAEK